jgi:REP element-mobilizing transposase RayT
MHSKQAPHRLYVHLAWTTLASVRALSDARRASIESHLLAACRWLGAEPIEACVLPDRVHLLVRTPSGLAVSDLAHRARTAVEELLSSAGRVVRWSDAFAAVTVSPRDVRRVRRRLASLGLDARAGVTPPRAGSPPHIVGRIEIPTGRRAGSPDPG